MALIKIGSTIDFTPNQMKAVDADGKPVLVVNLNGTFYAIGNKCTHMGCTLSKGTLQEDNVHCPCHGSTFDLKTGNIVRGPAKKPEPKYELKIENDQVLIST
jgi:nitrite reductase/ring-hydroxylating ferredoxin subunit